MKAEFTSKLMEWDKKENRRSMPWKGEKDPYRIWLSEVILQQTRVEQGWQYYEKFIVAFPTIHDLANSDEEKLFKLWEGLGYYTRCKNLHHSAKKISQELNGEFPNTYQQILSLKGVGPYTAAAIASFAFNLPHAVVDGNVERVISRYFGINTAIDSKEGKELYAELASSLLDKEEPGAYNQAIMDFGATICKPRNPLCKDCVQKNDCQAFQHGWVNRLPVKEKTLVKKERWFTYYILLYKEQVYIRKRTAKDIWANLFEFVLRESQNQSEQSFALQSETIKAIIGTDQFAVESVSPFFKQQLTHQTIWAQFVTIVLKEPLRNSAYQLISKSALGQYAFPKLINSYLGHT
jgi:A/G-specific adenine glycosylase